MAGTSTFTPVRDLSIEADTHGRHQTYFGTITVVAGVGNTDYATGGLTFSFVGVVPHETAPVEVKVWSDDIADGYIYRYVPAATPAIGTGKVAIFQGTATAVPFAQIAATTLPSAIANNTKLRWRATFVHGK